MSASLLLRKYFPAVVLTTLIATILTPSWAQEIEGELSFSVVVIHDLVPQPVPLTDFRISEEFGDHAHQVIRTDERGTLVRKLHTGRYTIESVQPVGFKDRSLTWRTTFVVEGGKVCQLRLTDADASQTAKSMARQVSDEAKVYQELKNGVVTVECDLCSGSGFVVDKSGLIVTNQHVTNGTRWAAVRFDRGIRVNATVVQEDKDADVAVLLFNPQAFRDFRVVPLADPSHGTVAVDGEKVLAIGSPLHQEKVLTTGIVSKVEANVLISDININHGNSGGPLLNLAGEAIGITTFGDFTNQGGPGISGIVAIQKAIPVLENARQRMAAMTLPPPDLLPDVPRTPIPGQALSAAATTTKKPVQIKAPKNFETLLFTPFTSASLRAAADREMARNKNRRANKRSDQGVKEQYQFNTVPFYWSSADDACDAVVSIIVRPVLKETSGSKWKGIFGAMVGVTTSTELAFRDDFYEMQLYRGDTLVQPVRRNRLPRNFLYESPYVEAKDTAYGGLYKYDPAVFDPSQPLTLKVRKESNLDKWSTVELSMKVQKQIWEEFAPYREAAQQSRK
jgi:Trypsin-like peptidase domain